MVTAAFMNRPGINHLGIREAFYTSSLKFHRKDTQKMRKNREIRRRRKKGWSSNAWETHNNIKLLYSKRNSSRSSSSPAINKNPHTTNETKTLTFNCFLKVGTLLLRYKAKLQNTRLLGWQRNVAVFDISYKKNLEIKVRLIFSSLLLSSQQRKTS